VTVLHGQRVAAFPVLLALLSLSACASQAPLADPAAEIQQGQNLYATNGCGSCHGPAGRGDGPLAKTLTPPPRNFRDAQAFKNGTTVDSVAQTIATGLTRDGGQMQPYLHLSERERRLLARFVISLREVPSTGDGNDSKLP
jgi:high-affinity iron transporter